MGLKAYAAALGAAAIAVTAFAAPPADAQTQSKAKRYYVDQQGRVVAVNRPRARITVAPRSFLDAGTEVLPGERKFTDYAYPPNYFPMGTVTNTGGKVGWDTNPLPGPFFLPSARNPYGW